MCIRDRVNIDLHDLNSDMKVFGMLTALEQVRNRMYQNFAEGKTTWLFIDEVPVSYTHLCSRCSRWPRLERETNPT